MQSIVIIGATGSGKSRLAVDLALSLSNCEVLSADSKQVYRGLDVGSAKASVTEQRGVTHHLVDQIPSHALYSVNQFRQDANAAVSLVFVV
jgi:tRNA dimethylallyltransferase